jgi:hypothetical protein
MTAVLKKAHSDFGMCFLVSKTGLESVTFTMSLRQSSPDMEIKLVLEDLIYVRYVKMENKKL